ncbi:DKNYY domain-containing protein [Pedobacter sp. L105]|uniref:DKNYY domain-containing protein n=1 Tax=Pedobacter sp. L105 TaxID=1641871 RepID=UPI00131CA7E0|nr:DKNYY domain-containing protein [Pedobacter sp. L105]
MKNHSILLTSIILITFVSCRNLGRLVDQKKSDSYFITSDQQILFCQSGNWFELGVDTMQADVKTFKIFSSNIAEDKNFVFYKGQAQKHVRRNSFYIENEIPKDQFHAYYIDEALGFIIIKNADPKTFENLKGKGQWARDKNHYFLDWKMINVDRKTFAFINTVFSEDKDSIYISPDFRNFQSVMPNPGGSKSINDQYIKIGKNIYFVYIHPDPKLMTSTFDTIRQVSSINQNVICVNNETVVSYGEKFKYDRVDISSFKLFKPVKEEGQQSHFSNDRYSKDKKNVYYEGQIVSRADVNTYTPLKYGFGKDVKNAFYKTAPLEGVDVQSFAESDTLYKDKLGNRYNYKTGQKL